MKAMWMIVLFSFLMVLSGTSGPLAAQSLTPEHAHPIFGEAAELSEHDGGGLWNVTLYGPILIVDPDSRTAVVNKTVASFGEVDGVYVGVLPDEMATANTAVDWDGTKWTMLLWPLPDDPFDRRALIAHELWHRIQDDIGLPSVSPANLHLGTRDGRVWLQLEWRALAKALRESRDAQKSAVQDALAFREKRHALFPAATNEERLLILHEGLAEYTGYRLSGAPPDESGQRVAASLDRAVGADTFVRTFAYPTGAAYGLLLDVFAPAWRGRLSSNDDLAKLLGTAIGYDEVAHSARDSGHAHSVGDSARDDNSLSRRIDRYDGQQLIAEEDRRDRLRQERLQEQRRRFVDGPTLKLDFVRMNVQFDPGGVDALDDLGSVYSAMRLTDDWGILTVTRGALITSDWHSAIVPAPDRAGGSNMAGEGYTLELSDGWHLVEGERKGDLRVARADADAGSRRQIASEEVVFASGDGITIFGDYYPGRTADAPLILLFHQGGSNARAEYGPIAPRLLDAGYQVLAIDQRRGGSRLGGENRTVAALHGAREFSYCDCYVDVVGTLDYARDVLGTDRAIVWGSSYSASLVFRLATDYRDRVAALLAFSPASGDPMNGCKPEPFASQIDVPALVLRPASEMELEHVATQMDFFRRIGLSTYVADPGVHGSSMLISDRVEGDVEPVWRRVLQFLSDNR